VRGNVPSDLLRIVVWDLERLQEMLPPPVGEDVVRDASNILRFLLVHGNLSRAWREAGFPGEPQVRARSLASFQKQHAGRWIAFASAGDATYELPQPGGPPTGFRELSVVYGPPLAPGEPSARGDPEPVSLSQFLSDPALIANDVSVSRTALINYVANKLGGTHYDETRSEEKDGKQYPMFIALDGVRQATAKMKTVHYELLAVGQTLIASDDVQTFLQTAKGEVKSS
jgi:hypothetical protein